VTRIVVVRLGSLGDLVHTLPAVAAIHRTHPRIEIDWLVDAVHSEFLRLVPILSSVVPLDEPTARGWMRACRRLRARRYDAALDFQGLVKSAALARLSGARRVIGFDRPALREGWASVFYGERVAASDRAHVIEKNLRLAAAVGAVRTALEFPIGEVDSAAVGAVREGKSPAFVLLNAGAAWPNKRWPAERLGRLAAWMRDRFGLRSVALWGPGEEALARAVADASSGAAAAAPPTRLADLVALSRAARLIVSGDTGPTHVAAAVGTPVVALFGPTDPRRNGPWVEADVSLSRYDTCACHYERRCRYGADRWCLATITETEVRDAVTARLGG
jgi:lipopolysaccharide heptosyltransferase I